MALSKRVRFGRRVPFGLGRLEFSSELTGQDGKPRDVTFRWEPRGGKRDSADRSERPADK